VGPNYVARFSDPKVRELFDAGAVPTPHTADADPLDVLREVAERNPACDVRLARAPSAAYHRTARAAFRNAPSMS